jgi:hypothetical protein
VLRDPDVGTQPLLKIQFSSEVRTMLGQGTLQLAKVMIEAAAEQISTVIDANDPPTDRPDVLH